MKNYSEYIARAIRTHGTKFDATSLDQKFVPYFESGQRIKVETCGEELTGTIGVTTGWRPCFLLMRTSRAMGSSWTLGERDKITAVKIGRVYVSYLNHKEWREML